jgi:NAD+ synthase
MSSLEMVPLQSFYRDPGRLASTIQEWLEDRLRTSGRLGGIVGLSGGIDSAVVAAMLRNVCGSDMLAVIMPCHSLEDDLKDAYKVADALDLPHTLIDLTSAYDSYIESVSSAQGTFDRLPLANVKPRLRMTTLYLLGQQRKYLVCGTGNKAELTIGYFTKYGDSGVDVLPLGDLLKGEVRSVARFLGVPEEVVSKPPSAGLWEGQTDEEEIGLDYDIIDTYLAGGEIPDDARRKIEAMKDRSSHKREMPPICNINSNADIRQR